MTQAQNVAVESSQINSSGILQPAGGGIGAGSFTANTVLLGNGTSAFQTVAPGANGNLLTSNGTTWVSQAAPTGMVYPGAGIPNSTGTAWGTSYTTTGSGTVVALATSPSFTTPVLGTPTSGNFSTGTFTWPTFNQNTTGTAGGLSGTPNITVGTVSGSTITASTQFSGAGTGLTGTATSLSIGGNAATASSAGNLSGGTISGNYTVSNASSPNTYYQLFGDNSGWTYRYMTSVSGTPTTRHSWTDTGNYTAVGTVTASSFSGAGTGLTGTASSLTVGTATTATNQSGGTVSATTGSFSSTVNFAGGSSVASNGDITARRSSGTSGVVYFGTGSSIYLYYDGSNFIFSGGSIYGSGAGLTGTASSLTAGTANTLANNSTITGLNFGGTFALTGSGASTSNSTGARLTESYGPQWNCSDSATWHHQVINGSSLCGFAAAGGNYGSGNIYASGSIRAGYSDERLKTRLGNIENALDKVCSLNGFIYVNNEIAKLHNFEKEGKQSGVSAQEVQKVLPEAVSLAPFDMQGVPETGEIVSKSGKNYLTVDYARMVPLLIEAIKELHKETKELKSELTALKAK
jgi:hypothetical protein